MKAVLLILLACVSCTLALPSKTQAGKKMIVCYYGSWAVYRPGKGKFDVEQIDPNVCTHLIYGFAGLRDNQIAALDPWNDLCDNYGKCAFERFCKLKEKNPELKTILGIGGWNEGSPKYSDMASSPATRKTFIDSVMAFLPKFGFDGLDVDWEYPTQRGGKPYDKENYISLLKELRAAFDQKGYLLSAALSAGKGTMDPAYDVPQMAKYLDIFNVMAYDYHGGWEQVTGPNTPMFPRPGDVGLDLVFNVNFSINYWISLGAPAEKMVLGMALYGRGWTLAKTNDHGYNAPAPQPIQPAPYTRLAGTWGYNEICEQFKTTSGWTIVQDDYYMVPYAYKDRDWISYDDINSFIVKSTFANQMGLGGGMVWSIETDDFSGFCGGGTFPLLKAMRKALDNDHGVITPPPYPITTTENPLYTTTPGATTTKATPAPPPPKGICKKAGFVRDPKDCQKYYDCIPNGNTWQIIPYKCGTGTVFNPATNSCDWPQNVPGCH